MVKRFWEIDLLKVLAIFMMIIFHLVYTLDFFGDYNLMNTFWKLFARTCAGLFIFLVGINLSYTKKGIERIFSRGLGVFFLGMVISLITWLAFPLYYVRFGILHFIGLAIILSILFLEYKTLNLVLGWLAIIFGWITYTPPNFYSFDYVPLFPWFGLVLMGIYFGKELYPNGRRVFGIIQPKENITKTLFWLSKHSLLIYFLHQPLILLLLKLLNLI